MIRCKVKQQTNQDGAISSLYSKPMKLIDQFIYLGSNISSTERVVYICIGEVRTANDRLTIKCKSDFSDDIKWGFI